MVTHALKARSVCRPPQFLAAALKNFVDGLRVSLCQTKHYSYLSNFKMARRLDMDDEKQMMLPESRH